MRTGLSLTTLAAVVALPVLASATIGERPIRAGGTGPHGVDVEGLIGSGLGSDYGLTLGARAGHTFDTGWYLGGSATRRDGPAGAASYLLGGDVGMKFVPAPAWELRPYTFVGAEVARGADLLGATNQTRLALQPGVVIARHFGPFYVAADGRVQITPTPGAVSLLGGAGLTF